MKWIGKHREIEFLAIASNSLLNLIYPNNLSRKQKLLNFKVEAALKIGIQPTKEQISISLSSISIKSTWAKSHWKTNRRHRLASTRWQNLKSSHEKKAHLSDIILNTIDSIVYAMPHCSLTIRYWFQFHSLLISRKSIYSFVFSTRCLPQNWDGDELKHYIKNSAEA